MHVKYLSSPLQVRQVHLNYSINAFVQVVSDTDTRYFDSEFTGEIKIIVVSVIVIINIRDG